MSTPADTTEKTAALSRDRIVKAAYQLAKKDPINALSMRKIASKLKVTPMAIYKYFKDKDELTAAVIDMQMTRSKLIPEDVDPTNWREWIRSSFQRMRDAYDEAPGMVQYMSHATTLGPAVLTWQNECLKVLITAGLTPKQALTTYSAIAELATGSCILVSIRKQGVERVFPSIWKDLTEGKVPNLNEMNSNGVSVVDYPWVLMCGQAMLEDMQNSRQAFCNEMDLILDSVENKIAENKAKK